ncbi:MAG: 5'-deoxyadenosine deaminase [Deinococcus sp.]|nr:5'-deoxyadenosine deaminase [Deinococcus sp.]
MGTLLIQNAQVVTMNLAREVVSGGVYAVDGVIKAVGQTPKSAEVVIDARGQVVIPGLVQGHIHLCQTLFRGMADDLELLDWLRHRIWPLEAAHTPESVYYSALLGAAELLLGGTTTILDMETVRHTGEAFRAVEEIGLRATMGKCLMDHPNSHPGLLEETDQSLAESVALLERWHGASNGRLRYCFAPRFVVSCSEDLLREVARLAEQYQVMVHTHAAENRAEIELVEAERGTRNVLYLDRLGLTGPQVALAHCIWVNEAELEVLAATQTRVLHCPSCNLKLASGVAPVPRMLELGIPVAIGADGAPANNNLDGFLEMRLAALIQKPWHGPRAMPAHQVFELATLGGARALGLAESIGSIEVGKRADLVVVDLNQLHTAPAGRGDVIARLVYAARGSDVRHVVVDGRLVVQDGRLLTVSEREILSGAERALAAVLGRAALR